MGEWSVEETEDIQEVDEERKPAAKAPFQKEQGGKAGHQPGEEKGSSGEREEEPDRDKEAPP